MTDNVLEDCILPQIETLSAGKECQITFQLAKYLGHYFYKDSKDIVLCRTGVLTLFNLKEPPKTITFKVTLKRPKKYLYRIPLFSYRDCNYHKIYSQIKLEEMENEEYYLIELPYWFEELALTLRVREFDSLYITEIKSIY